MWANLRIVLVTLVIFIAGLVTGIMTQHHHRHFGEFGLHGRGDRGWGEWREGRGPDGMGPRDEKQMAEMQRKMDSLRPAMEAFHAKVESIHAGFRKDFEAILTEDQKAKFKSFLEERERLEEHMRGGPFGMEHHDHEHGRFPMMGPDSPSMMASIIYKPLLQHLTESLGLTSEQQIKAEAILRERRQQVLNLVDSTPPPSLMIFRHDHFGHHGFEDPDGPK